jgi:hypothetical protein
MAQWIKAGIVENQFEGDRVSQALKEAGIPFVMKSFHDTAYDGLYIPQKGWGAVLVPEDIEEEAERVIAEVKGGFTGEEEDDETR